jgi:hypothetical protein
MPKHRFWRLPIVAKTGRLVGIRAFIELYGAGHAGLYLTLKAPDRAGLMVELSKAVLGSGGEIVGLSTSYDEASGKYRLFIKGQEIDKARIVPLLASLGYHVIQMYEV